jgi:hypothetical protein
MDETSGVALALKTGVPSYQVEDEEGRTMVRVKPERVVDHPPIKSWTCCSGFGVSLGKKFAIWYSCGTTSGSWGDAQPRHVASSANLATALAMAWGDFSILVNTRTVVITRNRPKRDRRETPQALIRS